MTMTVECIIISLIIAMLCVGFLRARRKNWALAALPLGFVPLAVGIGMLLVEKVLKFSYTIMTPSVLIMTSLMVACLWIGISSQILIKTQKMRIPYVGVSVLFIFTLSLIMLFRYHAALTEIPVV